MAKKTPHEKETEEFKKFDAAHPLTGTCIITIQKFKTVIRSRLTICTGR